MSTSSSRLVCLGGAHSAARPPPRSLSRSLAVEYTNKLPMIVESFSICQRPFAAAAPCALVACCLANWWRKLVTNTTMFARCFSLFLPSSNGTSSRASASAAECAVVCPCACNQIVFVATAARAPCPFNFARQRRRGDELMPTETSRRVPQPRESAHGSSESINRKC